MIYHREQTTEPSNEQRTPQRGSEAWHRGARGIVRNATDSETRARSTSQKKKQKKKELDDFSTKMSDQRFYCPRARARARQRSMLRFPLHFCFLLRETRNSQPG